MSKKIKFIPITEFSNITKNVAPELSPPIPASKNIPEWYSKSERFTTEDNKPKFFNYSPSPGLKLCVPFLDALISGYFIVLNQDIQVTANSDLDSSLNWLVQPDPIMVRDFKLGEKIPRPVGHTLEHYAWIGQFGIELPKNYSVLLTHPLNRHDLPFTTLSGIMDSDKSLSPGNIPFFLKANWSGIIAAGTPIAQLIPFKRDNWTSEIGSTELIKKANQQSYDSRAVHQGYYKKTFWTRKSYE
jgi:hypothetical protein